MIQAFPVQDRELAGVNPARCNHKWDPWPLDYRDYIMTGYATHMCQICFTAGRDMAIDITDRKAQLRAKEGK